MMCVENSSVQGTVISQPQTSHDGIVGIRALMYVANAARAPNDRTFNSTKGASGTATNFNGGLWVFTCGTASASNANSQGVTWTVYFRLVPHT